MNNKIAEVYEKTKDALLVDKYFGNELLDTFTSELILKANKGEYLTEAKRREKIERENS